MVEAFATSSITFTDPADAVVTVRTAIERRPVIWIEVELRIATWGPGAGSALRVGTCVGVTDGDGVGLTPGFAEAVADGLGEGFSDALGDGVTLGDAAGPVGATDGAGVGPAAGLAVGSGVVVGVGLGRVQHHQNQIGQPASMLTPVAG